MMAYENTVGMTARRAGGMLPNPSKLGPRPGWGTALGLVLLGVSLVVWLQAQSIVVGLMNGGHVNEGSATTALETLRRNAAIGSAVGSVLSVRVLLAAIQLLVAGGTKFTNTVVEGSPKTDSGILHRRSGRYASDMDPGGLTLLLLRAQHFFAGVPKLTAAFTSKAAVFLWAALSLTVTTGARAVLAPGYVAANVAAASAARLAEVTGRTANAFAAAIAGASQAFTGWVETRIRRLGDAVRPPLRAVLSSMATGARLSALPVQMTLRGVGVLLALSALGCIVLAMWVGVTVQHGFIATRSATASLARAVTHPVIAAAAAGRDAAAAASRSVRTAALVVTAVSIAGAGLVLMPVVAAAALVRQAGHSTARNLERIGAAARGALTDLVSLMVSAAAAAASPVVGAVGAARRQAAEARSAMARSGRWTLRMAAIPIVLTGEWLGTVAGASGTALTAAVEGTGTVVRGIRGILARLVIRSLETVADRLETVLGVMAVAMWRAWLLVVQLLRLGLAPIVVVAALVAVAGSASAAGVRAAGRETGRVIAAAGHELASGLGRAWRLAVGLARIAAIPIVAVGALVAVAANGIATATVAAGRGIGRLIAAVGHELAAGLGQARRLAVELARIAAIPIVAIATLTALAGSKSALAVRTTGRETGRVIAAAGHELARASERTWRLAVEMAQTAATPFIAIATLAATTGSSIARTTGAAARETKRATGAAIRQMVRPMVHVWDAARSLVTEAWKTAVGGGHMTAHAGQDLGRLAVAPPVALLSTGRSGVAAAGPAVVKPFTVFWLGLTTLGLLMKIGGKYLLAVGTAPLLLLGFVARTGATGVEAAPDAVRLGIWLVKNKGRNVSMSEINMPRERALSLLAVTWAVVIGGFFLWSFIKPPPPEPVIVVTHWTTGHLTREGLLFEMEEEFNDAKHRTDDGTLIRVKVNNVPSELIGKYLSQRIRFGTKLDLAGMTNGYVDRDIQDPTIVTPSSAHWLVSVNYEVGRDVVDLAGAEPIVRPVIGIVTYEEMARCLGWPEVEIGFQDIIDLSDHDEGWGSRGECAKATWGNEPLLAFTDPTTSSTGRSLHLALYSFAAEKSPEQLTIEDVNDDDVVAYIKRFQSLIDHYQIGTTVLNTKIVQGPSFGHFFVMPEDNLIHLIEGTESAYEFGVKVTAKPYQDQRMVMIYPKEGSMPRNNCACIVDADWVNPLQVEASHQWIDFIREDDQQRRFMAAGFRPGTDIRLDDPASKITAEFGLDPDGPTKNGKTVLNPSLTRPEVAAAIDANWEQVKRPAIVNFVIDTSGSMLGNKLDQVKDGVGLAMDNMASPNQVGMSSFASQVEVVVPIAPKLDNAHGTYIAETANEFSAGGETALFDAVRQAILAVDRAPGEEGVIRAIVVLTDGQANEGDYGLDDLVEMGSATEQEIGEYSGWQGSQAIDVGGNLVPVDQVIGRRLRLNTTHEVQVFFIGVGDDADLNVGRILAQATGADLRGATEDDLAQVLQEFSRYF